MLFFPLSALAGLSLLVSSALAVPHTSSYKPRASCENSASDRSCWGDYDLSTNYYNEAPDTGVTREYWLELVNTTVAPDGVERIGLTVNGTFPGPTIEADWGDTVVVHLYNGLENNGTGIHFHGIRQNWTNPMDGVPSITQCPIAPGESMTYTWKALQYGTTWYHSHFALQAWDGILGGITIHGPASVNYDVDLGSFFLNDWTHQTTEQVYISAEASGPPTLDNGLINGTNIWNDTTGSRYEVTFTPGTRYRFRVINGAIDTHFKFMIDNHTMEIMAMDLVPIVPFNETILSIGIGQRYDVVFEATESTGNYWMRAIPQSACSDNTMADNIKGIVRYDSTSTDDPTTSEYDYTDSCDDMDYSLLVPYLSLNASSGILQDDEGVTIGKNTDSLFRWKMNSESFTVEWDDPTLLKVYNDNDTFASQEHVVTIGTADEWTYFVIETTLAVPHPIHLHGHDFYVLAQGSGTWDSAGNVTTLTNPPRRDVAMLPSSGYLVIGFPADNPGVWLMHCHIGWHTSEGLALQIVERWDDIASLIDYDTLESTCSAWDSYISADDVVQDDSGV